MSEQAFLRVKGLNTIFQTKHTSIHAIKDISFQLKAGEVLCLLGESGSGKSVTALSILQLIDPPGSIVSGEIWLEQENIRTFSEKRLAEIRGKQIAVIFQNPMSALNPVMKIGIQLIETIRSHKSIPHASAREEAEFALMQAGLAEPEKVMNKYPYQLSGGMLQRVMIAMAISLKPRLLIADEPTSALDVTVQAQIINQLKWLKDTYQTSILLITHDWSVAAQIADHIAVMKEGEIIEYGSVLEVFDAPRHAYTQSLLNNALQRRIR